MRGGFIALAGAIDPAVADRVRRLPRYQLAIDMPGLLVACTAATDRVTTDREQVVVFGTLFDRSGRAAIDRLDAGTTSAVMESGGRTLIDRYWGSYTAFLVDAAARSIVVRDPSGGTACYYAAQSGMVVLTSNVREAVSFDLMRRDIEWGSVAAHLLWPERRVRQTCLDGIRELMPGECMSVANGKMELAGLWHPWRFTAAAERISSRDEAVELIQRATLNTVGSWSRRYARPLVSLSGGLDSSIVLAGTRKAAAAITFTTEEPLGDEREYARAVAERYETQLIECQLESDVIDPRRSAAAELPRPVARLFGQELDNRWRDAVTETRADALFHGGGGDNVFCYLATATPYLDSLLVRGPGRASTATLDSLSHMQRVSRWAIRRAALRKLVRDRGHYRWFRDTRLLSTRALRIAASIEDHPWFEARPPRVLPGKEAHVAALIRIQNYLEATEPQRRVPVVAPLMSQPVMEACLRVPTWLWCENGINRSVARDAFRKLLPRSVIERSNKGSPAAFDAQIVARFRREIADMLCDGFLAREGLVDEFSITRALAGDGPLQGNLYQRVTELVDVEAWLQSWVTERPPSLSHN